MQLTPENPTEFFKEMIDIGASGGGIILNTETGDDVLTVKGKGYIKRKVIYAKRVEFSRLIVKEVSRYGKYPLTHKKD
jgi:hypothetical protein